MNEQPNDDQTRAHVYVSGRVQGVFFRASTREQAHKHGVAGWVKNLEDGRVEAVFEGPQEAVESVVNWCHEGSPASTVEGVAVEYTAPDGVEGFEIRR